MRESLRSLATNCELSALCAREDVFLAVRQFPNHVHTDSLQVLNAIRDANFSKAASCASLADLSDKGSSEVAKETAIIALNKTHTGSKNASHILALKLAHASTISPRAVISCLLQACLRHRAGGEQRTTLRECLGLLGSCATMQLNNSSLNICEEWIFDQLESLHALPGHARNLTHLATSLLTRLPIELLPPLDLSRCLFILSPKLLVTQGATMEAVMFVVMCFRWWPRTESPRPEDVSFVPLFSGIFTWIRSNRKQLKAGISVFDEVLECLELLNSWVTDEVVREGIWRDLREVEGITWPEILWLWCRGFGTEKEAVLWQSCISERLTKCDDMPLGSSCAIAICECLIIAVSQCPPGIFQEATDSSSRLSFVREFVRFHLTKTRHEPPWSLAFARQIPLVSSKEHELAVNMPSFCSKILTTENIHEVEESNSSLCKSFSLHVNALNSLLRTQIVTEQGKGNHFGGLSLHGVNVTRLSQVSSTRLLKFVSDSIRIASDQKSSRLCLQMLEIFLNSGIMISITGSTYFDPSDSSRLLSALVRCVDSVHFDDVRKSTSRALANSQLEPIHGQFVLSLLDE